MYIIKGRHLPVLIFKHLEDDLLECLSLKDMAELKKHSIIGLYIGHIAGVKKISNFVKYCFIVAPPTIAKQCRMKGYKGPILELSGFNFIPDEIFSKPIKVISSKIAVCVGDFQRRKGIKDCLVIGANLIRAGEISELWIIIRAHKTAEKVSRLILTFIFWGSQRVKIKIKKYNQNLAREDVLNIVAESYIVIAPYKSEGAARVVAEAEALGKPLLINQNMQGGSQDFLISEENIFYKDATTVRALQTVPPKCRVEKWRIYGAENNAHKFRRFLEGNFGIMVVAHGSDLVNAFSGHRNELPPRYTSRADDQIRSVESLRVFLNDYGVVNLSAKQEQRALDVIGGIKSILKVVLRQVDRNRYIVAVLLKAALLRIVLQYRDYNQ